MNLRRSKQHIPTDLEILNEIYERYYHTFADFNRNKPPRAAKVYVPISIDEVARRLDVDPDIVFGRLYYHLEEQYGYANDDGSRVHFFALRIEDDVHCVHFPYVASVLADLRKKRGQYLAATGIALVSLAISLLSLILSVFARN